MTQQIKLPQLFDLQRDILEHPARFKVLCCGRRFSKTTIISEFLFEGLLRGEKVAYFAPSEIMTLEIWENAKITLAPIISRVRENDKRMELHNGGIFECWTTRTEAVRGRAYHRVAVDEAALIPSIDYWHTVIRPLLTDYEGKAFFASTPRGQNWFWDVFNYGQAEKSEQWQSWHYPTTANPYIPKSEVEVVQREMPERAFKQEYLALFLEDSGAVFRNINKVCVGRSQDYGRTNRVYAMGIDWGRDFDFSVISVMDVVDKQQVHLARFNQISYTIQQQRVIDLYERFKPQVILAEANSIGSVNIDALRDAGLPVRAFLTTKHSKSEMIDKLVLAMEQETITLLNDADLKQELNTFTVRRSASGSWDYGAPVGTHDDIVIATALSYQACGQYGRVIVDFV